MKAILLMMSNRLIRGSARSLAITLALLTAAWAPGPAAYEAVAASFEAPKPIDLGGGTPLSPVQTPQLPAAAGVELPNLAIPQLPVSAINAASALTPASALSAAQAAQGATPVTNFQALQSAGQSISQAKSDGQTRAAIETLFTGAVSGAASSNDGAVLGSVSAGVPPLSAFSVADFKSVAQDSRYSSETRAAAVKRIADRSDDPSRLALQEIGAYDANATAADYEVKRQALRALKAQTGDQSISLPAVGEPHKKEILDKLSKSKPQAVVYDYHGTWEASGSKASPETAKALAAGAEAGVETMILTGGPAEKGERGGDSIFEQLSTLTPQQKARVSVGTDRGAEIWGFDKTGERQQVERGAPWTDAEKTALAKVSGAQKSVQADYEHVVYFPDASAAELATQAARVKAALEQAGVNANVAARSANDHEPAHLTIDKYDKTTGVSFLLNRREAFERLRDANRWLPKSLARAAAPLLKRLKSNTLDPKKLVVVGDDFAGPRDADGPMLKAAPGAMALSVGERADPNYDNLFVMPSKGHVATLEIADAISAKVVKTPEQIHEETKDDMDVKATGGWIASSVVSIVVFVLVSLAHPLIAQQYLGGPGLALVMALGPVVSILTGPLNGRMANKMTMRNGMALNAILRAILLLDMPTFMALGMVNFWTLALGAMANGWLLSAIMATEGAYMKSFGGKKNIGTIFAFAQSRYLVIQVAMNSIIVVGTLIDHWNKVFPATAFLIASVAHIAVVLPIILGTIPNKHIDYRETGEQEIKESFLKTAGRALWSIPVGVKNWIFKDRSKTGGFKFPKITAGHVAMALALATFVAAHLIPVASLVGAVPAGFAVAAKVVHAIFNSPLLLTGSILYWVGRSKDTKVFFSKPKLGASAMLIMLAVAMMYPIQYVALPMIALHIAGAAGKGALLSSLLGALFFGQLVANSSKTKFPEIRIPFIGRFGAEQLLQKLVMALAVTWVGVRLMPGSILGMAAAAAVAYGLTKLGHSMSDKASVKSIGIGMGLGLAAMAIGYSIPGLQIPMQFLGLLTMGMAYSLGFAALNKYQMMNAENVPMGTVSGVNGSFLNSGISLGYGALSLLSIGAAFPALFVPIGVFFGVGGLLFFLAPKKLPGLPAAALAKK